MSQLGLYQGNVRDALAAWDVALPASPSTFYRASLPRFGLYDSAGDAGQAALVDGVMTAVPIKCAAGDVITNVSFVTGAATSGTEANWWVALYSSASTPALLAQSADQLTADVAVNTVKTVALSAPQTITQTGYYWAAIMMHVSAGAVNSLIGTCVARPVATGERNLSVSSGSGLTTTATATLAAPAVKSFAPYVVLT
ncbi:hypothetical protein Drose_04205 [Dactylosporangium roseum]|uniref:Uncharacterized protein n=1 Tax=Dactylosporangium roseum TaxID=47989 RepID=A0ABY5Z7N4_9ACTN|nr:hypothetical protein [Dactylosporangium roseum]UWZ37492.1 hypothetical protein Drose_04205 [Dactylosporangium roseum]